MGRPSIAPTWWVVTVADAYQDRRMLKWLPFESLEEQGDTLRALYDSLDKEEKPELSQDHLDLMQYSLEEALFYQSRIVCVYYEKGRRKQLAGFVLGVDTDRGLLFLDSGTLILDEIIDIEK